MFKKSILALALALVASPFIASAWAAAPGNPPACDPSIAACNPPINVSATDQTKTGSLTVGNVFWVNAAASVLRLANAGGVNYIQSGLNGNVNSAADLFFGPILGISPWMVIKSTGYVGIGIPVPTAKLQVNGTVKISGSGSTLDLGNNRITSVADNPTLGTDAANKNYVDGKGMDCTVLNSDAGGDNAQYWMSLGCTSGYVMTGAWCYSMKPGDGGNLNPHACSINVIGSNVWFYTDFGNVTNSVRQGHVSCCRMATVSD